MSQNQQLGQENWSLEEMSSNLSMASGKSFPSLGCNFPFYRIRELNQVGL